MVILYEFDYSYQQSNAFMPHGAEGYSQATLTQLVHCTPRMASWEGAHGMRGYLISLMWSIHVVDSLMWSIHVVDSFDHAAFMRHWTCLR